MEGHAKGLCAVWEMAYPLPGAINIRVQDGGSDGQSGCSVVPSEWKAGVAYDTSIRFN